MVFSNLSEKLQETFRRLRGKGKLGEKDVDEALRQVKLALLEADVNFRVVRGFINRVKERAIGQEVLNSLTPGQMVIKIVHQELAKVMGEKAENLKISDRAPSIYLLAGLQGAGKTTTVGKLGAFLKKQGRRPLLTAADVYRPAAAKQLQVLGEQIDLPVYCGEGKDPVAIAAQAVERARQTQRDIVLIDTAGRLHINEELMDELLEIKKAVNPVEILLVVDAMTGQDAVTVAQSFNEKLGLTGLILTKLDSDTRGGAALSIREVTGCPIKFIGTGEKMDGIEVFHPQRLASRILGMGDVLTLIEKVEATVEAEQAKNLMKKIQKDQFTLEDFMVQMRQVQKMGPLEQVFSMIPGMKSKQLQGLALDEKSLKHIEAIIQSMTIEERRTPQIINASRRKRIARGSGRPIQEVNRLLNQFEQSKKMMKQLGNIGKGGFPKLPFI
ncbi:MAG TPA: signal recognition particle protein [Firmicutes bacterium]|jgi:signal recognition particle subunit SRP54|nr:signal recognition particle protein [Bacillota bacterium]